MDISMNWKSIGLFVCIINILIKIGSGLECYACENQDTNQDKCIKTTIQCLEHQDRCITTVAWGLPPYWTPYGERYHYVWKGCDTTTQCEAKKKAMMPSCKRDWYDDWSCIECCSGDLCNYYVTLGASSVRFSTTAGIMSLLITYLITSSYG